MTVGQERPGCPPREKNEREEGRFLMRGAVGNVGCCACVCPVITHEHLSATLLAPFGFLHVGLCPVFCFQLSQKCHEFYLPVVIDGDQWFTKVTWNSVVLLFVSITNSKSKWLSSNDSKCFHHKLCIKRQKCLWESNSKLTHVHRKHEK